MLWTVLVVLLVLALLGGLGGPSWGWYGRGTGYGIGGLIVALLVLWLVFAVLGGARY